MAKTRLDLQSYLKTLTANVYFQPPENVKLNYPCIIYDNQMKPIGFINLCKWLGEGDAYSWSYYIDRRYQGNGYGKSAAQVAINVLKAADCNKSIKLATEEDNHRAQRLYAELGFVKLQELDGDDIVFGL